LTVLIRRAESDDWPRIWPLWHRVVATGDTYMWLPDTDEATARTLWMQPPPAVVYVAEPAAESGADLVGTAMLRPNNTGLGDHVANASFMVDPHHAGRGIGRRLAEHVLAEASAAGYRAMQFNAVVETNTAAVALWRSLGFRTLATVPAAFRHATLGPVGVLVMYREL
jgi:ribosomal protein S18 acetylase RimI-like enzyme